MCHDSVRDDYLTRLLNVQRPSLVWEGATLAGRNGIPERNPVGLAYRYRKGNDI